MIFMDELIELGSLGRKIHILKSSPILKILKAVREVEDPSEFGRDVLETDKERIPLRSLRRDAEEARHEITSLAPVSRLIGDHALLFRRLRVGEVESAWIVLGAKRKGGKKKGFFKKTGQWVKDHKQELAAAAIIAVAVVGTPAMAAAIAGPVSKWAARGPVEREEAIDTAATVEAMAEVDPNVKPVSEAIDAELRKTDPEAADLAAAKVPDLKRDIEEVGPQEFVGYATKATGQPMAVKDVMNRFGIEDFPIEDDPGFDKGLDAMLTDFLEDAPTAAKKVETAGAADLVGAAAPFGQSDIVYNAAKDSLFGFASPGEEGFSGTPLYLGALR